MNEDLTRQLLRRIAALERRLGIVETSEAGAAHSHSSYLNRDGSVALTADWDIGDTRKLLADTLAARDAAGLSLQDDGGNTALTVNDGGTLALGTVSNRIVPSKSIGQLATKTGVASGSATTFTIAQASAAALAYSYLVTVESYGGSTVSAATWIITGGYSTEHVALLSQALFGHSSLSLTTANNTTTGAITLTFTQTNGAASANSVRMSVLPLASRADTSFTLTGS